MATAPEKNDVSLRQKAAAERAYEETRPDDNPFIGVVEQLRSEGKSFEEIHGILDEAYDAVDSAWGKEMSFLVPDWKVTAVVDDPDTPSGKRYERYTRSTPTAEEAEELIERHTGYPVDSDQTELVGYSEVA